MLVGVKNSEELSTSSPKIFRLKRQINTLQHSKSLCSNATDGPEDDGAPEFLSDKQHVVKENFMNSKFLEHKGDDDDIVSPIIKESELDDDDEDSKTENNEANSNNELTSEENNFSIDESEPSVLSDSSVPGEARSTGSKHEPAIGINVKPSLKSETVTPSIQKDSDVASHQPKEDRLTSELSMINDDVLSFDNDLRLDLPDKSDKHNMP